jgi:hypothetical protein
MSRSMSAGWLAGPDRRQFIEFCMFTEQYDGLAATAPALGTTLKSKFSADKNENHCKQR